VTDLGPPDNQIPNSPSISLWHPTVFPPGHGEAIWALPRDDRGWEQDPQQRPSPLSPPAKQLPRHGFISWAKRSRARTPDQQEIRPISAVDIAAYRVRARRSAESARFLRASVRTERRLGMTRPRGPTWQ
jgi:hypothetical protein